MKTRRVSWFEVVLIGALVVLVGMGVVLLPQSTLNQRTEIHIKSIKCPTQHGSRGRAIPTT